MDPDLEYGSIALLVGLVIMSVVTNILALMAYCRRKGIKNVSDRFVVNVLIGDVPMSAAAAWSSWETLTARSASRALAAESTTTGLAAATLLGVFLVAADQHRAVTDPLRYRVAAHRRKPAVAAAVAWALSLVCSVACVGAHLSSSRLAVTIFRWVYLCVIVAPPVVAVVYMNIRIYSAARYSRAATPGAGAVIAKGSTSAGKASATTALIGILHIPPALTSALALSPYCQFGALALLSFAAFLAPFPLALRSRRVRRELRKVIRPRLCSGSSLRPAPRRNASAGALRLLSASDVEKGEGGSTSTSITAELTIGLCLPVGQDDARASFSSGASTQMSVASDE